MEARPAHGARQHFRPAAWALTLWLAMSEAGDPRTMRAAHLHTFVAIVFAGAFAFAIVPRSAIAASVVDLPVFARIDANYQTGAIAAGLARSDSVLAAARGARDERLESAAIVYRAIGLNWSRSYTGALALVDERMTKLRRHRDAGLLATAHLTRAYAFQSLLRTEAAIRECERAASCAAAGGRTREVAYARLRLGWSWLMAGRSAEAAREYRAAIRAATAARLPAIAATAHVGLGNALNESGDAVGAQQQYYAAIGRARVAGALVDEADALCNLGTLELTTGDASRSLPMLRSGRELYRRLRRPEKVASASRTLAIAELWLGDFEAADSVLESTRREFEGRLGPEASSRLLAQQAVVRTLHSGHHEGLRLARAALALADSCSVPIRSEIAIAAARVFTVAGETDSALVIVEASLARPEILNSGRPRAQLEMNRAHLLLALGRPQEAIDALRASASRAGAFGYPRLASAQSSAALACAQRDLGRPDSAAVWFEHALQIWEQTRRSATGETWREMLDTQASTLAFDYVCLLLAEPRLGSRADRVARAFDIVQRFRGRSLTERRLASGMPAPPVTCAEFRRRTLLPGEVFVDILQRPDSTIVFAIARDSIAAWGAPGNNEFFPRMSRLREALEGATGGDDAVLRSTGSEIGMRMLGPGAGMLSRARTVIFAAGGISNLPWGALQLPGETEALMMYRVTSACPSATLLHALRLEARRPIESRGVLVAACTRDDADQPLPGVIREAQGVAAVWQHARVLRDREIGGASGLLAASRDADVVHIAAHARTDATGGWASALLVGNPKRESDWLDAATVAASRTSARVCAVSSCRSAGVTWGESVRGLATAWLAAGARCVVAIQWNVDDESAAEVMTRFHRLLAAGHPAGEALKLAQAEVKALPRFVGPAHWAGVVLFGDPSVRVALPHRADATRRDSRPGP